MGSKELTSSNINKQNVEEKCLNPIKLLKKVKKQTVYHMLIKIELG